MLTEQKAIEVLKDYIAKTGKQQAVIAKELSVSPGLISSFLSGTYKTPHTLIPKIEELIKITGQKEALPKEPPFKMTTISQTVINVIKYCHLQGKIGVAYGDAGIGKTMAIKEYIRQNPDAIMVTITPVYATIAGINELLSDELRIKEKSSRKIFSECVSKLTGSNRVIIIDEAQHLTVRVINHLRSITDASGIGIAFIGNEEIYLKMRGAGHPGYAQLFSRIGTKAHLLTAQIKKADIGLVFEDASLDEEAINSLHKISKTHYGLRGAVNVFVNTIIGYKIQNCSDITAAKLSKMAIEMGIS